MKAGAGRNYTSQLNNDLFQLQSYDYHLPEDRIAQFPVQPRHNSRLVFLNRTTQEITDSRFLEITKFLQKGDLLVLNNTRVIPARLQSNLGEVLLIRETETNCWDTLVYPGKKFRPGSIVKFQDGMTAQVLSLSTVGRILRFEGPIENLINNHGLMPLPPYIHRAANQKDRKLYQTIYARVPGSVAAPTAGLHFTQKVLAELRKNKIEIAKLTLHVGPGTFRPVKSEDIRHHSLYSEFYWCSKRTWNKIQNARRVIAVGTTTTRALETIASTNELHGSTGLFIYPGFNFQIVRGLITNFHLPKSSLLMLVSAFAGYDAIRKVYEHAIRNDYRFYSYGDAMLIL
ncbi:MAG TPA: tRNA preQ1(34) S-adenosylmethionine ribosyltransferase-isomerase QueA [Acidobacteriota bacterium]|nr:tRNA preQ1(34) S-adenosylmethionine ribosyltransferase-isomerase QueA [Acidobacteriota bacterium]